MSTSLALIEVNKRALAVRQILENEGAENAETALVALAESQGDAAVAVVIGNMRPIDLNKLVRDFDYTKSSVAIDLLEPQKAAELLKSESSMWSQDHIQAKPEEIQADATSLICQLVLVNENDDRRRAVIEAIAGTEWGGHFLRFIFVCREDAYRYFKQKHVDYDQVFQGDWQELLSVMSILTPLIFDEVGKDVCGDMLRLDDVAHMDVVVDSDDDEEEIEESFVDPIQQFQISKIRELRELAGSKQIEAEDEDTLQLR